MKYEWKKKEKEIYLPKEVPTIVTIPKFKYLTVTGKGNPNTSKDFQDKIGVLYSLSYAIRMMPKNGYTPIDYFEYTVYPLEGTWSGSASNKDSFEYKIMIRQPWFVNEEVIEKALEITKKKKPSPFLDEVNYEEIEEGLCVQMLHIGSYDDEPKSFEKMQSFIAGNGYERTSLTHKEVYLSNASKVEKDELKTVLRYCIRNKQK